MRFKQNRDVENSLALRSSKLSIHYSHFKTMIATLVLWLELKKSLPVSNRSFRQTFLMLTAVVCHLRQTVFWEVSHQLTSLQLEHCTAYLQRLWWPQCHCMIQFYGTTILAVVLLDQNITVQHWCVSITLDLEGTLETGSPVEKSSWLITWQ